MENDGEFARLAVSHEKSLIENSVPMLDILPRHCECSERMMTGGLDWTLKHRFVSMLSARNWLIAELRYLQITVPFGFLAALHFPEERASELESASQHRLSQPVLLETIERIGILKRVSDG